MPRREPRPMKLAGDLPFPKADLMPSTAGALKTGAGESTPHFGDIAPIAGEKQPGFASGGRRGIVRFPSGSRRFTRKEVKRGYRIHAK